MIDYVMEPEPGRLSLMGGGPTLRLKTGFAANHLLVAVELARAAHEIEKANADAPFGPWFDGMMRCVPVSIVMSGAALEAAANELLQDILDDAARVSLPNSRMKLLAELLEDRSGNAIGKFRKLALLMDYDPDTGTEPWHNGSLLVKFRNEFMHFRPAWDDDDIHTGGFVQELSKKVPVVEAYKGKFQFPYGFMTYGCAKWAVEVVLKFSAHFAPSIGRTNKFAQVGWNFTLPTE